MPILSEIRNVWINIINPIERGWFIKEKIIVIENISKLIKNCNIKLSRNSLIKTLILEIKNIEKFINCFPDKGLKSIFTLLKIYKT